MIVKRKGEQSSDGSRSTSMVVGKSYDAESDEVGDDCEEELYNFMRGHTTLMITGEEFEEGEDESDSESESGDQAVELVAPDWGSSSNDPSWGKTSATNSSAPEWGSTLSRTSEPSWGSSYVGIGDQETADEWTERERRVKRMRRTAEIQGGYSPPPKLKEENLFSERDFRPSKRATYKTKEEAYNWGWGEPEDKISDVFEKINNGSFNPEARQRRSREDLNPYDRTVDCPSSISDSEEDEKEDTWIQEVEVEESSVIGPMATRVGVMGSAACLQELTRHDSLEDDEENEWLIIKVPKKMKNKSFVVDYCDGDAEDEFQWLEGPHHQEHTTVKDLLDRRRSQSRRERRRQGHTEFRDDEDLDHKDPHGKRMAESSSKQSHDLSPKRPKRKGLKELLEDWEQRRFEDGSSPRAEEASPKRCVKEDSKGLQEVGENNLDEGDLDSNGSTRLNSLLPGKRSKSKNGSDGTESLETKCKDEDNDDNGSSSLMVKGEEAEHKEKPLHDVTCVGIDTCSARSISCLKEDFLDLELVEQEDNDNQLRGVGGNCGVAGKGCLVFYVKDMDGKVKAIIEPRGFYLKDPPAEFRILGQQQMKKLGVCATQDYDNAGTDILKCKRSESILPLTEERGLLLIKNFPYHPDDNLKQQLQKYILDLKKKHNFLLPHVVDLDSLQLGQDAVLILNEGKLKKDTYERLLHWRLGHTNPKALKAMDLIEQSHLNEDCFCCNEAKFKRAPFPKNEGAFMAVAEPYWRLYIDGFGGQ